jgi:hypothetical protein
LAPVAAVADEGILVPTITFPYDSVRAEDWCMTEEPEATSQDDELPEKQAQLLQEIAGAITEGARIEAAGREMALEGRRAQDHADVAYVAYKSAPLDVIESVDLEREIEGWRTLRRSLGTFADVVSQNVVTLSVQSMAISNSTSAVFTTMSTPSTTYSPSFLSAREQFFRLHSMPSLLADVGSSLRRLQLDSRGHGHRSATDLLDEAVGALERPVIGNGRPTSTLLPLRGAIDAAFAVLVSRRPTQEPAKNWYQKVRSIGGQCARAGLGIDVIERLAEDGARLNDELSEAKEAELSRVRQQELFCRVLLFLKTFLLSVDESRLRPA